MKAQVINRFGGPSVFELAEVSRPEAGANDVLIRTIGGSVNPIDWKQRYGNHKFIFGAPFPIVLGYDVAGIVEETGKNVKDFSPGDKVFGVLNNKYGGGLGEYAMSPEHCFTKIPAGLDIVQMAALPLSGLTALQALRDKGRISAGKKVLIIGGAGGVGQFAVQIAAIYHAEITVVSSARHKSFIEKLAPVAYIDYQTENFTDSSNHYDIVFDTVGKYPFPRINKILAKNGIYISNLPRPKIIVHKILALATQGKKVKTLLMRHVQDDLKQLAGWAQTKELKINIDKEFSIINISAAHEYSESGHAEGKILIHYNWQ